ncbi:FkbM family methyltransferase [Chloroflexota bacterium]
MKESNLSEQAIATQQCRYGLMSFLSADTVVGRSLREYGEWAQTELDLLLGFLQVGDTVVDIGAFIGTHALAFAQQVGPEGNVYAFEPHPKGFELLNRNVIQNSLSNVKIFNVVVSDCAGFVSVDAANFTASDNLGKFSLSSNLLSTPVDFSNVTIELTTLDSYHMDRCDLIKVDVEGMEYNVLKGSIETLRHCRPLVFAECLSLNSGWQTILLMRGEEFEAFLHNELAYNPDNFRRNTNNIFTDARETNIIFVPKEKLTAFRQGCEHFQNLITLNTLDDLALGLLKKPQYKYEVLAQTKAAQVLGFDFFANEPEMKYLNDRSNRVQRLEEKVMNLNTTLKERDAHNEAKIRQMETHNEAEIRQMETRLQEAHTMYQNQLAAVYSSWSWRITRPVRLVGALKRAMNSLYIRRAFGYLRRGDIRGLLPRIRRVLDTTGASYVPPPASVRITEKFNLGEFLAWVEPNRDKKHALIIDHNLGGGANHYREVWIKTQHESDIVVVLVYYDLNYSHYRIRYLAEDSEQEWFAGSPSVLSDVAGSLAFCEVFFNNAYSFPDPLLIPSLLPEFKERSGAKITIAIHDYFPVCPAYTLLNDRGMFCRIPDMYECRACLSKNKGDFFHLARYKDIDEWRATWGYCLKEATRILCFSKSSVELVTRAYPDLDPAKFEVKPHNVDYLDAKAHVRLGSRLNIGVVGNLSEHKGAGVIREIVNLIDRDVMPVSVTVIGAMGSVPESATIRVTGEYKREDLPMIIEQTGANVFFVPSVWPETFCYVAEELMALGLPVSVFNVGAPPERISKYDKGLVIDEMSAKAALSSLIAFHRRLASKV